VSLAAAALVAALAQRPPLERQAFRAYQARDWVEAARLYGDWHASGKGTAATYDYLGVAFTSLGRLADAEAALLRAIEMDPRHRWAYNHVGFVYREQGRHEQAIGMFRRQIEISPRDPYAWRNLAATLALTGRLGEADRAAASHEQYTYERGAVYIDMACSLNSLKQPDQARKYLERAETAGAERSLLAQEWAHYFLTTGQRQGALEQYRKLLEYRPHDPLPALRLGAVYLEMGKLDEAAAAFARVIEVNDAGQVTIRTSPNTSTTITLEEARRNPPLFGDLPLDLGRAVELVRERR